MSEFAGCSRAPGSGTPPAPAPTLAPASAPASNHRHHHPPLTALLDYYDPSPVRFCVPFPNCTYNRK